MLVSGSIVRVVLHLGDLSVTQPCFDLQLLFFVIMDQQAVSTAGRLSNDCSLHVADALALDKLMKALRHQPQLEALDIQFQGPYLSSDQWALDDPYLEDYRDVSDVTARMFQPAWRSACLLLQNSQMFRLR